ncbi:hypothetical protein [Rubritalea tangerina]|uniref:hypothetical protein n=1 Tax=Rubritalea tangerina TaxID=430798 RepID=UPI003622CC4E
MNQFGILNPMRFSVACISISYTKHSAISTYKMSISPSVSFRHLPSSPAIPSGVRQISLLNHTLTLHIRAKFPENYNFHQNRHIAANR